MRSLLSHEGKKVLFFVLYQPPGGEGRQRLHLDEVTRINCSYNIFVRLMNFLQKAESEQKSLAR